MYLSGNGSFLELQHYSFRDESELQQLLYDHYEVVMNIPEIDTSGADVVIKYREFATSRGSIDVLYITKDAELYLIETKLIRNPESTCVVISQVVDYIKAITVDGYEVLLNQTRNLSKWVMDGFVADDRFYSALKRNVLSGNINGIIIWDDIHPNLLGLLEFIQSAPHLAFHINLVRVEAFRVNSGILINAFNVENTLEVERSWRLPLRQPLRLEEHGWAS